MKLRATFVVEYEADPKNYEGCNTPEEIAALDQENAAYYPETFFEDDIFTVKVEVVEP